MHLKYKLYKIYRVSSPEGFVYTISMALSTVSPVLEVTILVLQTP